MIEVAHGRFPFALEEDDDDQDATTTARRNEPAGCSLSILELLQHIVFEPPPQFNPDMNFPPGLVDFVQCCLTKDPMMRPTPMELKEHEYVRMSAASHVDLISWIQKVSSTL